MGELQGTSEADISVDQGPLSEGPIEAQAPNRDLSDPGTCPARPVNDALRRSLDIFGAVLGLFLCAAALIPTSIAILVESGRPVFFGSRRFGKEGRLFTQWKFRSMQVGAEQELEAFRNLSTTNGPSYKAERDPRATSVGAFLRRWSIDELPQFFNVLRGEMSLVGPRPVQDIDFRGYPNALTRRNYIKPGLTGLWQVSGRSSLAFSEMMRLDLDYVDRASVLLNLKTLIHTIPAALSGRGAY